MTPVITKADGSRAVLAIRASALPLSGDHHDFDRLIGSVGSSRYVLLGEASHGTHEFYRARAEITKRLIRELNFTAVAAEADWPDAYRVNRFARGSDDDADATDALGSFRRFPQWMWRNADVLDFVGWLRAFNEERSNLEERVGFYGLDLYSMHASMAAVLEYLDKVDPDAARRARQRYHCFDMYGDDPQEYGYASTLGITPSCEREVIEQLLEMQRSSADYARRDGREARDAAFYAEQNARLVRNAEEYYRMLFLEGEPSWNYRDEHMAETLELLATFLDRSNTKSRVVVWAHNSHIGDARATEMTHRGELNLGQLVRSHSGDPSFHVGFTTFTGSVTAASNWNEPAERKSVRPALAGSYEELLHVAAIGNFYLDLGGESEVVAALSEPLLERAIGVIYRPETERMSHYFRARLPQQFDAVLHYDRTRAVEPLERTGTWDRGEFPDTYPSAL